MEARDTSHLYSSMKSQLTNSVAKSFRQISGILVGGMLLFSACHRIGTCTSNISLQKMDGFPSKNAAFFKGVSALYAGTLDGQLIIGGGCNFPDVPVADGGKKVYYKEVYAAPLPTDTVFEWRKVGTLPEASGYGVTISTDKGLVCIGGSTASRSMSEVFRLSLQADTLVVDTLPSLPVTMDNMAGALLGNTIYVVGGNAAGIPSTAVYSLDLSALQEGWKAETPMPGNPRVQPVCAAQGGKLYVWGGFAGAGEGREATLSVDGYAYTPETKEWTPVATPVDETGEAVSLGGGVALPLGEDAILCAGGVNKDIFLKAIQGIYTGKEYLTHPVEWYKFNRKLLVYRTGEDRWTCLGDYEQGARAGAVMVADGSFYYIINGELKPGIRTNVINRIKIRNKE